MHTIRTDTTGFRSGHEDEGLPYLRWLAGLFDGLLSLEMRTFDEYQLLVHVRERPILFAAFVSGVVSDLMGSLPAEDPWRHTMVVEGTAMSQRGEPFGTWTDATDLLPQSHSDVRSDANLAALISPLSKPSALIVHLGARDWRDAFETLGAAIRDGLKSDELFSDGCAAIRWVIHRRRTYLGPDDPYTSLVMRAWVRRAHRVENSQPWDEARRARLAKQEKVGDGVYEWFTAR